MRPVKCATLAALEAAFAEARSAPLKSQIKKRARELAAAKGEAVPTWALPSGTASPFGLKLPEVLVRWRAANTGRSVELDRFGAIVLSETMRFARRQAVFSTIEAAVTAVVGRTVPWEEPRQMYGTRHR